MAASEFLKKRVEDEKKKTEQKPVASAFLQNLAKGSKETVLNSSGARVTYDNNSMGLYKAPQRVESNTPKKAGISPALPSIGGTVNPRADVTIPKPTMAGFKALMEKKQPTVNINLDQKPMQNRATLNPSVGAAFWANKPQRSTSLDRKTMLYETNDSLLSPQEILEKYRYVVNDQEMDRDTRDLAAKKGLAITGGMRDKSLFGGGRNPELIHAITALQGDLTYMTKAYARGKGYGDAYGLNYVGGKISDNYVEKSGDPQLKAAVEARKRLGQKTVEDNPLSVMAGRFVGDGIKYASLSPSIEAGTAQILSGLGAKAGVGAAPAISKGLQFGGKILGMQAADTLLTTPAVILEGMESGKGKKEIAKDVAKEQAMDLAFNLGFGALGAGANLLKYKKAALESSKRANVDKLLAGRAALPSPRRETNFIAGNRGIAVGDNGYYDDWLMEIAKRAQAAAQTNKNSMAALPSPRRETNFIAGNRGIAVGDNGYYDDWLMEIAKRAQAAAQSNKNSMVALPSPSSTMYAAGDGKIFDSLAAKSLFDQKNTPVTHNPYGVYYGKQKLEKKQILSLICIQLLMKVCRRRKK